MSGQIVSGQIVLTTEEAAARLRVCKGTIYRMVKSGRLAAARTSEKRGHILIPQESINFLLGKKGA